MHYTKKRNTCTYTRDKKTLFYCATSCIGMSRGKVVALDMDDTFYTLGGFALRPDSEFLSVFNHYLLKVFFHLKYFFCVKIHVICRHSRQESLRG